MLGHIVVLKDSLRKKVVSFPYRRAVAAGVFPPDPSRADETALYAGGHGGEAIPVPIPNTEVKLPCADDTPNGGK